MTPHPIYKQIGAVIKARRKTLELRQEELAKTLGISRGALANVETGRQSILVHQLYRIAAALKLSPFDLLPQPEASIQAQTTALSLPDDLKALQKIQIARFIELVNTEVTPTREVSRAKTKR